MRRWLGLFFALILTLLLGLFAFNAHYDPYLIFAKADAVPPLINGKRGAMTSYSYVAKAIQIVRKKPAYILLGTSVTDGGFRMPGSMGNHFDPDKEAYARLQKLIDPHPPIYNAALRGKSISEAYEYLLHAYANNPQLKEVYLGIDWTMFTHQQNPLLGPSISLLGKTHVTLSFILQYSLSWSSTKLAFEMWEADHAHAVSQWDALKQALPPLRFVADSLAEDAVPVFAPKPGQDVNHVLKGDSEFQTHNFIFTAWFIEGLKNAIGAQTAENMRYPGFEYLQKIVDFCHEKHIALKVFITPKQAFYYGFMRNLGLMPYQENWFRQVVRITPVWDFSQAMDFGPTPDTYHKLDSLHFIPAGGEVILPQLLRDSPDLSGVVIVTPENVEQVISAYRSGYMRWEAAHPALDNSILTVDAKLLDKLDWNALPNHIPLMPVVFEPDYHGYRIFKCMNRFIAVPVAQAGDLSLNDAIQYETHHWPSADSLDALAARLQQINPHAL